ncbi:MAG: hypothetical protein RL026_1975 [Pseudomonadota bacterium]
MSAIPATPAPAASHIFAQADADHWRRKYLASVRTLEQEERAFRSLESLLRRLLARLCLASFGQSPPLDQVLGRLAVALRNAAGEEELEPLFTPIADAVAALERRRPGAPSAAAGAAASRPAAERVGEDATAGTQGIAITRAVYGDERIRETLDRLLGLVRGDPELLPACDALALKLGQPLSASSLPLLLSDIADVLARRVDVIEREKREVEGLLSRITQRLDELTQFLYGEDADRREARRDSDDFNRQLAAGFHALRDSVGEVGTGLDTVRERLEDRLAAISEQVQAYRQREQARTAAYEQRSESLRAHVEQLEDEARRLQDRLRDEQRLASVDALTQVPNRLALDLHLAEAMRRCHDSPEPTCIVVWDIDHFKRFNDSWGHRAGDRVLRAVAQTLAAGIRQTDFVGRYGGEEFVMVLEGYPLPEAMRRVDALRIAVSRLQLHFRGSPVTVSVSSGLTLVRQGDTLEECFERADKALYRAKEQGRNRCVVG